MHVETKELYNGKWVFEVEIVAVELLLKAFDCESRVMEHLVVIK